MKPVPGNSTRGDGAARRWPLYLRTLILAAAGGGLATLMGWPSSWLLGALALVGASALVGLPVAMPRRIMPGIAVMLGLSIGSNLDQRFLPNLVHWQQSLGLLAGMLLVIIAILVLYYRRLFRWPTLESFFCAVPGNLAIVMTLAADTPANLGRIALVQSVRLTFLIALIPLVMQALTLGEGGQTGVAPVPAVNLPQLLAGVVLAACGGWLARRLRCPAPYLLGSLLVTAVLRLHWQWQLVPPRPAYDLGLIVLGGVIGARLNGLELAASWQQVKAGLGGLAVALGVSLVGAFIANTWLDVPLLQALLAFVPGGVEAMVFLAITLHIDPAFVGAHHLFRILLMSLLIPLLARFLARLEPRQIR